MLYSVVEPCDRKSVTSQEFAVHSTVPVSAADVIVPLVVVVYVNVVVVGTVAIVHVPSRLGLPFVPDTVITSPARRPCAVEVVRVAVEPVRALFEMVLVMSPCHS